MEHESNRAIWTERVAEWRASGLSATQFGLKKNISAANLYNWASKLRHFTTRSESFPVARVVRSKPEFFAVASCNQPITIEIAAARVVISSGFDKATLVQIIDVLSTHHQRGA